MSYVITDTCLNCGECIGECPQDAIVDGDNDVRKILTEKCN
jgi:ferredoxin